MSIDNYKTNISLLIKEIDNYFNSLKDKEVDLKNLKIIIKKYEGLLNLSLIEEAISIENQDKESLIKEIGKAFRKDFKRQIFEVELNTMLRKSSHLIINYRLYTLMRHLENSNYSFFEIIENALNNNIKFNHEQDIINYVFLEVLKYNNNVILRYFIKNDFYLKNEQYIYNLLEKTLKDIFNQTKIESYYDINIIGSVIINNINKMFLINDYFKEKNIDKEIKISQFESIEDFENYLNSEIIFYNIY